MKKTRITKRCIKCNIEFECKLYLKDTRKFCSNKCRSNLVKKNCIVCNKEFIVKGYREFDAKFCSRSCLGYSKVIPSIKKKIRPATITVNGKQVLAHRHIMEEHLGRKLEKNEVVHHIDFNKKNNSIENLMVMTDSEHNRLHSTISYHNRFVHQSPSNLLKSQKLLKLYASPI